MSREQAEEAYAKGDLRGALISALALWEETRAAAIADAIDAISSQAARSFSVPDGLRINAVFQKKWIELAKLKDPIAVQWLADNLFVQLPGKDLDQKQDAFIARLKAARAVPDPRMARAVMTLVEQGAPVVNWSSDDCKKTLIAIGDERTAASLDLLIKADDRDARGWKTARQKLAPVKKLTESDREAWDALGPRTTKKASGDRQALFDAVLAAPADEQAREVLADCLQELGDPRGEFISIQLAELRGQATPEATKRADALLKQHKKAWLGSLARVTYRAWFRGGFLSELELDGSWKASKKQWADIANDPLLATATYIHGKPTPDIVAQLISSPVLRALEKVYIDSDFIADAIERTLPNVGKTLREIRAMSWKRVDILKRFGTRVLPLIEAIPSVDALALDERTLEMVMASKAWKRIQKIHIPVGDAAGMTWWLKMPEHITEFSWDWSEHSMLRRRAGGGLSLHLRIVNEYDGANIKETVAVLKKKNVADQITHVEVSAPKKHLPKPTAFKSFSSLKESEIDLHELHNKSGFAAGIGG